MTTVTTRLDAWRGLKPGPIASEIGAYAVSVLRRFVQDRGMQSASSLTYMTLLSLVPLLAFAFAIFAAFPAFEDVRVQLEQTIFEYLVPGSDTQIRGYLNNFLKNTGQLGAIGVVPLGLSALLLLANIEATLNRIWRGERTRSQIMRFLIYWSVLTMGPLLIGAGITLTTNLASIALVGPSQAGLSARGFSVEKGGIGDELLSISHLIICFMILFAVVPNRRVAWRDALIGGCVSGAGFQILKAGFAWYLANVFTYQTIYGAMAAFPIFLIWLYLSWCVILLGAAFAASFPDWWMVRGQPLGTASSPARTLAAGIRLLGALKDSSGRSRALGAEEIAERTKIENIDKILRALEAKQFVARTEGGGVVLSRDLSAARVHDLHVALGLDVLRGEAATDLVVDLVTGLAEAAREVLAASLSEILDQIGREDTGRSVTRPSAAD